MSSEISELSLPHTYLPMLAELADFGEFLALGFAVGWWVSHTKCVVPFYIDVSIPPLDHLQYHSGQLTQLALRRFFRLGRRCPLPGC